MEKYVAYLRVSTKEQGRSGLGLEAQRRDMALFVHQRPSEAIIAKEFVEVHSGSDNSRQILSDAISFAKKDGATLLVSKLDRLSRKVSFIASIIEDRKLDFKVASMPNADKFQLHIYAALAEQERDFISLRTKAALAEKKAMGAKLGGLRDKTNQRNKEKAKLADANAKKIWPLIAPYVEAGQSLGEIARRLNACGINTVNNKGFRAQTIKNIVSRIRMDNSN